MDEAELHQAIKDVLEGDIGQFERIMQAYQRSIFVYCYHMLGNHSEAEDCGQEVFLKAFRYLKKYDPNLPFGAWLYKIAYHQCIDVIRRRKLARYLPFFYQDDKQNTPVDLEIEAHYFDETVHRALSVLSMEERNLLILRCVEDKSYQEIGLILNRSSPTLRKRYERAAAKFRKAYVKVKGEAAYGTRSGSGVEKTFS